MTIATHIQCLAAACGLLALLQPTTGYADSSSAEGCKAAALDGESQADASGAFVGTGTLGLDDAALAIRWVSRISSFVVNTDGTLAITSSHRITSAGASIDFTTNDVITGQPTDTAGQYTFSSYLAVASGTGRIKNGFLHVLGRVDLNAGHVVLDASEGLLCATP